MYTIHGYCIVCDQGTQNRKMYNLLGDSPSSPMIKLSGKYLYFKL